MANYDLRPLAIDHYYDLCFHLSEGDDTDAEVVNVPTEESPEDEIIDPSVEPNYTSDTSSTPGRGGYIGTETVHGSN